MKEGRDRDTAQGKEGRKKEMEEGKRETKEGKTDGEWKERRNEIYRTQEQKEER